jgi:TorA maturation chaperone TorD
MSRAPETAPLQFLPTLPPEELARANFYGLLARLLSAPPDAALLRTLAAADELEAEDDGVALAWRELANAAADADPEAVREEYEAAFIGVGKAPITLYTSAYSMRYTNEAPLAQLREQLSGLGLARRSESAEPEDHIAALFEVMRHLIADPKRDLEEQKRFFERWIWPVVQPLCDAITKSELTPHYRAVAKLARAFLELEHAAFEML